LAISHQSGAGFRAECPDLPQAALNLESF